jgi:RecB family endonuclease NucS
VTNCCVSGCNRQSIVSGICVYHYARREKYGTIAPTERELRTNSLPNDLKWAKIDGFPDYEVSESGDVRRIVKDTSREYGYALKGRTKPNGSVWYTLKNANGRFVSRNVSRLVFNGFLEKPTDDNVRIIHVDGDKSNNHCSNLRWEPKFIPATKKSKSNEINLTERLRKSFEAMEMIKSVFQQRDLRLQNESHSLDVIYEILDNRISESEIENKLAENVSLIEDGMVLVGRQVKISGGRLDLLCRDKNGTLCIVELKANPESKDLIFQCAYYPTQFNEKTRMITIAPDYKLGIVTSLQLIKNVEMKIYTYDNEVLFISDFVGGDIVG